MESLMTLPLGKVHDVKVYNDDNGRGVTSCGLWLHPWSVTKSGLVTCRKCMKARKATS